MEKQKSINSYLSMKFSSKYYYIMNNTSISGDTISDDNLFHNIREDMTIVFRELKVYPNKSGYQYWIDAVFLYLLLEDTRIAISKDIYPVIAKKYNTTAMAVERAMRLCFENTLYDISKLKNSFIATFLHSSLITPRNNTILSKIIELISSKEYQSQKFKF